MPTAPSIERYQPSFLRYPIQNNKTGFKPVFLPIILIVPGRRTPEGLALAGAEILELKYFIADAPERSRVAGPFNTQLLVPALERYVITITDLQLSEVPIDPKIRQFYDTNGNAIDYADAVEGDSFEYTQIRGGITSKILYYPDADYYDLSLFEIDVEDLPMPNWYHFVWQATYHPRVVFDDFVSSTAGSYCINQDVSAISQYRQLIGHPGDVHYEMFRKTPPFFFDNQNSIIKLSNDQLLAFYRPFADMLQDIFDEQAFLNGVNHVDTIPAQLIPYLAYLIGWDLPNYPGVTDTVRRSILRQAVMLQQLKGSRRAIVELFDIFGYSIELLNVWYSTDGTRFVAPNEKLPDVLSSNEITTTTVCQIEPLVANYGTVGFGSIDVPLMYRVIGDITVTAWLVQPGTTKDALDAAIEDLNSNPNILTSICIRSPNGSYMPKGLLDRLPISDPNMVSMTELVVNRYTGEVTDSVSSSATPILSSVATKFDNIKNILTIVFDHYIDFSGGSTLYIFATYPRTEINIPNDMINLRSNRFDVNVLLKDGQVPSSQVLDFLLNFIFKLKAFHSLLRKIRFTINNVIAYNVQDYCSDAASSLQVPPAIIPFDISADKCDEDSKTMGYKEDDLTLRKLIYQSLLEEHAAWRSLDGTHVSDPSLEHYLNLPVTKPRGTECQFTNVGQDRLFGESTDLDHNTDAREVFCSDEKTTRVNCFTGRVKDNLDTLLTIPICEVVRCKPCFLGSGYGTYYVMPMALSTQLLPGFGQYPGQNFGHLKKLYRDYNHPVPVSLHYTNRQYMAADEFEPNSYLALNRPPLGIQKDNFGFPGHRFLNQANLENDFITEWKAKPWDYPCSDGNLNARIIIGTDGEEHLIFDDQTLIYKGNGLPQDISSFGTHVDRSYQVTHKIYIDSQSGNPAITLDSSVVETSLESITFDSLVPFDPLFKTYNPACGKDYISGYPASYGRFDYDVADVADGKASLAALFAALDLPSLSSGSGTGPQNFLFTYGSQILLEENDIEWQYYIPYRYDCGCTLFPCSTGDTGISDATSSNVVINRCSLDFFRMPNGQYDFNCDKLELDIKLLPEEKVGACGIPYDGSIPFGICITMTDGECPEDLPEIGSYRYKDEYDTIHEGYWTFKNTILDLTVSIKQPYIWGQPPEGYIQNKILFRKGIITITRYIYKQIGSTWELQAQGTEQFIDFIQMNPGCGDAPFIDNFCYHFYCGIVDNLENIVVCGSHWTDVSDLQVEWPTLTFDGLGNVIGYSVPSGIQPFLWVNVWGNNDLLVHVCPSGTSGGTP